MSVEFELTDDNKLRVVRDSKVVATVAPGKALPHRLLSALTSDEKRLLDAKLMEQRHKQKFIFMRDGLLNLPTLAQMVAARIAENEFSITERERKRLRTALELLLEKISV